MSEERRGCTGQLSVVAPGGRFGRRTTAAASPVRDPLLITDRVGSSLLAVRWFLPLGLPSYAKEGGPRAALSMVP
jgi:hypothetical protein